MIDLNIHKTLQGAEGQMNLQLELHIKRGQFVTLYGASGAGKTSTLRILSGLLQPEKGRILVNGATWLDTEKGIHLKAQKRKIGYVFQDYALFPNMTVRQNLEFALSKKQNKEIVSELIETVELGELQDRKPNTLSGGQQQRVALARALVQEPEILLLDEPLSALDIKIRLKLQDYLLKIHKEYELTTILVSHDIGEIHKLSDWVVVLENGGIARQGSPTEVFIHQKMNGAFTLSGEILKIEHQKTGFIATVLVQNTLIEVGIDEKQAKDLNIGEKIIISSKTFEPIIHKIIAS